MKKNISLWAAVLLIPVLLISVAGAPSAETGDKTTLFGNKDCFYCIKMIVWLDEKKIPYEFLDVTRDQTAAVKMTEAAEKWNLKTTYYFPVMIIRGQLVMRPSTSDVEKALAGVKISGMEERLYKTADWRMIYPKSMKYTYEEIRSRVSEGDVTIYDSGSVAGRKMMDELRADRIPFKFVQVTVDGPGFSELRAKLDSAGFGSGTVLPVAEVKGRIIMNAVRSNDIRLMLIEILGD